MTLEQRITALAQTTASTLKAVKTALDGKIGTLSALNTTQKGSLVLALNELKTAIDNAGTGLEINDTTPSGSSTYSSTKINSQINAAIAALIGGADINNDTLKELADQLVALAQADNGLVSATQSQTFTEPQKTIGRNNIGAASAAALATLTTNVGNTDADFVGAFTTEYNS